jgi:hypothetical protein
VSENRKTVPAKGNGSSKGHIMYKKAKNLHVDIKNVNTDYSSDKMLQTKDKSKNRFFEANILGGPKIFSFFSTFWGNILSQRRIHIFLSSKISRFLNPM